jgi:hypothetical protein
VIDVVPVFDARGNATGACHVAEAYPPYFHEALACLSATPLRHINGSSLRATGPRLVRTAWMGLGPRCRGIASGCNPRHAGADRSRLMPTPKLMAGWRGTLGACFGLDPAAPAPLRPANILVVDRLYESNRWVRGAGGGVRREAGRRPGTRHLCLAPAHLLHLRTECRHILNVATVMRTLRARFDPRQVALRLEYMEVGWVGTGVSGVEWLGCGWVGGVKGTTVGGVK